MEVSECKSGWKKWLRMQKTPPTSTTKKNGHNYVTEKLDDKTWEATHFRSGAQSLQVNKNRSRCGHVNTVIGKCSLGDPVSDEDSMRVEQLNYFEKVLDNSMATSEERVEQLRELGCRATRWMKTATGFTAAEKGWTAAIRTKGFQQASRRGVRRTQRSLETWWWNARGSINANRSMKVMGVNLPGQFRYIMRCDKQSVTNFGSSTEEPPWSHSGEALHQCRQYTGCVSRTHQSEKSIQTQNHWPVKSCGLQWVVQEIQGRELRGQENLVWNTDLIETMAFENLIGQATQSPYSGETRNESQGAHESRRFPRARWCAVDEARSHDWKPSTWRSHKLCWRTERWSINPWTTRWTTCHQRNVCTECSRTLKTQFAGRSHSRQRKRGANLQTEPGASSEGDRRSWDRRNQQYSGRRMAKPAEGPVGKANGDQSCQRVRWATSGAKFLSRSTGPQPWPCRGGVREDTEQNVRTELSTEGTRHLVRRTTTHRPARHELALWSSTTLPGWSITRVGPGQYPRYTRADFGQEAVGGSTTTTNTRRRHADVRHEVWATRVQVTQTFFLRYFFDLCLQSLFSNHFFSNDFFRITKHKQFSGCSFFLPFFWWRRRWCFFCCWCFVCAWLFLLFFMCCVCDFPSVFVFVCG